LLAEENKKFHNFDSKEDEHNKHYEEIQRMMIKELEVCQKEANFELNNRIQCVIKRIADIQEDLVRLSQLQHDELTKHNGYSAKRSWFFSSNIPEKSDEKIIDPEKVIGYVELREKRKQELTELDSSLEQLSKQRAAMSSEFTKQVLLLTKQVAETSKENSKSKFENRKEQQKLKIKNIEQMKDDCIDMRKKLQERIKELQSQITTLQADDVKLDEDLKNSTEKGKEKKKVAKKQLETARSQWKQCVEEYNKKYAEVCKKYGHYDIEKVNAFGASLTVLSNQCKNIGLQFREINAGISLARKSFSGENFSNLLALLPKENKQMPLLEVANCYSTISLIAFRLFQQPISALLLNDLKTIKLPE